MSVPTFITPDPIESGATLTLGEEAAHHLRVLRLEPGARVQLADGQGGRGIGTVMRIAKRNASVEVAESSFTEPLPPVHLIVPIADRDRMLWLGEKATELGVTSWRPVMFKRSRSVSPRGEGTTFQQKLLARMGSALEQSGGAWLPMTYPDATVETAIAAAPPGVKVVLDKDGAPMLDLVPRDASTPVTIVLGPEGGLEPSELELLTSHEFQKATLASNMLRFETAGVAGVSIARAARR